MKTYQDRWTRYHDKPTDGENPSSNNGWIYTGYAVKLGLPVDHEKLDQCFRLCVVVNSPGVHFLRSPGKVNPPMSRDEILGMFWSGVLTSYWLRKKLCWNFSPYPIPPFNPFKTIAALWRMRKAHRNAVWENGGEPHLFRFAFSVPIHDRVYMLRTAKEKVPLHWALWAFFADKFPAKSNSSKLIKWRKGKAETDVKVFEEYFGEWHPFTMKVKSGREKKGTPKGP